MHIRPGQYLDGWLSSGMYAISVCNKPTGSTQPCIPPGSLNWVPASAGVKAGMSPLSGGRQHCVILYGMWVPVAVWQVRLRTAISVNFTLHLTETVQSVGASRSRSMLRSSSTSSRDYSLPRLRTKFSERAFSHAGHATWNALPVHIRTVADPVKFRKLLKSLCFNQAFNICWLLCFSLL